MKKHMLSVDELIQHMKEKGILFKEMDENVAMEILRGALMKAKVSATRPQMKDFLKAIKEYAPGKKFNLPGDKLVRLGREDFTLEMC